VPTRGDLLLLLRKQPGITVAELADKLGLSAMGVRRHVDALADSGLVERHGAPTRRLGRPAAGWRLTDAGVELFPRRYEAFAIEVLEDVADACGAEAVVAVLAARTAKDVPRYRDALAGADDLAEQVRRIAQLRDDAGYLAETSASDDGAFLLVEHNCAVHRLAERHPAVCSQELELFRTVLGPEVEVTRVSHTMSGDSACSYCIRRRTT
jgi:predicted ArsR family transcriptional regulator